MKILALDTSTEFCTLTLWLEGAERIRECRAGQRHSELLPPMLDELLAEAGISLLDLDGIAFGAGPGSFTGLRIACGIAQGLAFGADLPVVGIPTLLALAEAAGGLRVIAALDARMGEVYHGVYEKSGQGWHTLHGPSLCKPQDAPLVGGTGWIGAGSGFAAYEDALRERYGGRLARIEPALYPHAREIARLAAAEFRAGRGQPAERAAPLYVRNKVALTTRERLAKT